MAEQVNWELEVLTKPEDYREWLQTQARRGIERLRENGAQMSLMGGPTAASYLQLHVASGCVFHLLTNFRGMLVAVNLATEATQELADELEILHGSLEDWILTQEWRSLMSVEVPLAHLDLSNQPADRTNALVDGDDLDCSAQCTNNDHNTPVENCEEQPVQLFPRDAKRLARRDLRAAFPETRFTITSRYMRSRPGGGRMTVSWEEGPEEKHVEAFLDEYLGFTTDGYDPFDYVPRNTIVDGRLVSSDMKVIELYRSTTRRPIP